MSRLPPTLRPILTALSPDLSLEKATAIADRVYEILPQVPSALTIGEASSSNSEFADMRREMKKLRSLKDQMAELARECEHETLEDEIASSQTTETTIQVTSRQGPLLVSSGIRQQIDQMPSAV